MKLTFIISLAVVTLVASQDRDLQLAIQTSTSTAQSSTATAQSSTTSTQAGTSFFNFWRWPTRPPINQPTARAPSVPTPSPTPVPTQRPTPVPTRMPIPGPTKVPTTTPTSTPTRSPTKLPTARPTANPTPAPTSQLSSVPKRCGLMSQWWILDVTTTSNGTVPMKSWMQPLKPWRQQSGTTTALSKTPSHSHPYLSFPSCSKPQED